MSYQLLKYFTFIDPLATGLH
uniref:Uncharacterized protein n=1 Tax=Anguilla anguilla TaxID=7936 RepID=A0A0E9UW15_ANGAN